MATYEHLCLACEHPFEVRRPMADGQVVTAIACPSCGSDRVRRRFTFSAAVGGTSAARPTQPGAGGCCGGGGGGGSCGCS